MLGFRIIMATSIRLLLVLGLGAGVLAGRAFAQSTIPAPASPSPDKTEPQRKRAISGDLAAALAAGMPKYEPPKPVEKRAEEEVDLRDIDKPKNEIIRLPQMVVEGYRPAIFTERDLTRRLADLALRRYRGLGLVPFAGMNRAVALQMYAEDERLRNMSNLNDTADAVARGGDQAGSEYIRRETNETFLRRGNFTGAATRK